MTDCHTRNMNTMKILIIGLVCLQLSMADITDYDVVEKLNIRLNEIRSKLLDQAIEEVLNDNAMELCQQHRHYMKSVMGERHENVCVCAHMSALFFSLYILNMLFCNKQHVPL